MTPIKAQPRRSETTLGLTLAHSSRVAVAWRNSRRLRCRHSQRCHSAASGYTPNARRRSWAWQDVARQAGSIKGLA